MNESYAEPELEVESMDKAAAILIETGMDHDDAWDFIHQAKFLQEGLEKTYTIFNRSVTFRRSDDKLIVVDPYGKYPDEKPFK